MRDLTRALSACFVVACVVGGGIGAFIGAVKLAFLDGDWKLMVGCIVICGFGLAFSGMFLDEKDQNQGD